MGIIQRQGIANAIITYTGILIGFVSLIYIQPRFLSKEELGLVRVLFSFSALIGTVFPLGSGSITFRYFPFFKNIDKRHHGFFALMVLWPMVGFAAVALLILLFKSWIISRYINTSALFTGYFNYVFLFTLTLGMVSVLTSYLFALFKTIFPGLINEIIQRLLYIAVILLYYFGYIDFNNFLRAFIGIYVLQLICLLCYILIVDRPGLKINADFLRSQNPRSMISYGLVLSFSSLASLGLKYLDVVMLGQFVILQKVGIYAVAAFIPTVIEAPLNALDKITNPKIGDAWAKEKVDEIKEIYFKSTKYLMLIGGLLFLGINLNIKTLYKIIPNNYSEGIPVVIIISIGTFVNMCTGVNDAIIFNSKKYIYGTYMLLILLTLAVVNNLIFIPRYGITGAAFATALSAFVYNLIKYFFIWKNFRLQPFDFNSLKILIVMGLVAGLNLFFPVIQNPVLEIIVRSVAITFLYGLFTMLFSIVPEFHGYIPLVRKK
jgi:O-antigen/teichoic acid export membrane protein